MIMILKVIFGILIGIIVFPFVLIGGPYIMLIIVCLALFNKSFGPTKDVKFTYDVYVNDERFTNVKDEVKNDEDVNKE